jgi:transposase
MILLDLQSSPFFLVMPISPDSDFVTYVKSLAQAKDIDGFVALTMDLLNQRAEVIKRRDDMAERCDAAEEDARTKAIHIKHLTRLLYGRRSEKLNAEELAQLDLAFGGPSVKLSGEPTLPRPDEPVTVGGDGDGTQGKSQRPKHKRPNHKGRTPLPANLERIVVRDILVPDSERQCKCCGVAMTPLAPVEHETIEHIPEKIVIHVERREKLACKACQGDITTASRQDDNTDVRVGNSFLAALLDDKGEDALPINRQADRIKRLGWPVPYDTLLRYWTYAADLLIPIADATVGKVLDDHVVGIDDTGLIVLGNSKGDTKFRGHLWCITNPGPLTGFRFTETWSHKEIIPWIDATTGFIQVDDYKGYGAIVNKPGRGEGPLVPRERRLGCMMHVRRRFYEALAMKDKRAARAVALIKQIYQVEAFAKETRMSPDERMGLRREKSIPLLKQLYDDIESHTDLGSTSKFAKAVRYAIAQKEFIERCFSDGRFEIDNGKTEREIRRPAVGRRNYLFTGSVKGGERLAAIYTLILSCRNLGIDTREYLIDVLGKVRNLWPLQRLNELTPDAWAKVRTPAA